MSQQEGDVAHDTTPQFIGNYTSLYYERWIASMAGNVSYATATHDPWTVVSVTFYAIICFVGLVGNGLVIFVIIRYAKMKTVTNTYILNLAVSDFCFLIGLPFLITTAITKMWVFGYIMCKVFYILTSINWYTSVFTLMVMSVDRYIAVCHPVRALQLRKKHFAMIVCGCVWCVSFLAMLPIVLYGTTVTVTSYSGDKESCSIVWPGGQLVAPDVAFIWYSALLGFAIPVALIAVLYALVVNRLKTVGLKNKSRQTKLVKRRVTKMVLTVIAVYVMCWLPYWVFQVYLVVSNEKHVPQWAYQAFQVIMVFSYANSMFNPFLYAFMSEIFRKSFVGAFQCEPTEKVNRALVQQQQQQQHTDCSLASRKTSVGLHVVLGGISTMLDSSSPKLSCRTNGTSKDEVVAV